MIFQASFALYKSGLDFDGIIWQSNTDRLNITAGGLDIPRSLAFAAGVGAIPAVSTWGMLVMLVSICVMATIIVFRRRTWSNA